MVTGWMGWIAITMVMLTAITHGLRPSRAAARVLLLQMSSSAAVPPPSSSSSSSPTPASKFPRRLPTAFDKKTPELAAEEVARVKRAIQFLDASPEPFHCVATVKAMLEKAGFVELKETELWRKTGAIKRGGKYYFTRNGSSLLAFVVGEQWSEDASGFKVIGAHTDSPNLKLKPRSKRSGSGLVQLNVECYGGGLWHTWFDRDLSLAGRVIVRRGDDTLEHRLVRVGRPVLRVPNLAIHLRSAEEREVFKVNKEDHIVPILCDHVEKAMTNGTSAAAAGDGGDADEPDQWASEQQPELMTLLEKELGFDGSASAGPGAPTIVDFEMSLYDTQGAATGGLREEFLCSSRIDNLASCFVAVEALLTHAAAETLANDADVSVVALFDHEEVGSGSHPGAGSTLMRDAVVRISNALAASPGAASSVEDSELFKAALARSMIFSVDMAHAVHPNYASKHEKGHAPRMNHGVVIKSNGNQRYATSGVTGFYVRELGRRAGVPVQVKDFHCTPDDPSAFTYPVPYRATPCHAPRVRN